MDPVPLPETDSVHMPAVSGDGSKRGSADPKGVISVNGEVRYEVSGQREVKSKDGRSDRKIVEGHEVK
jgi:hypothetical protein